MKGVYGSEYGGELSLHRTCNLTWSVDCDYATSSRHRLHLSLTPTGGEETRIQVAMQEYNWESLSIFTVERKRNKNVNKLLKYSHACLC